MKSRMAQEAFIKAYRALPGFRGERLLYLALSHRHQHRQNYLVSARADHPVPMWTWRTPSTTTGHGTARDREPENALFGEELKAVVERAIKGFAGGFADSGNPARV